MLLPLTTPYKEDTPAGLLIRAESARMIVTTHKRTFQSDFNSFLLLQAP